MSTLTSMTDRTPTAQQPQSNLVDRPLKPRTFNDLSASLVRTNDLLSRESCYEHLCRIHTEAGHILSNT